MTFKQSIVYEKAKVSIGEFPGHSLWIKFGYHGSRKFSVEKIFNKNAFSNAINKVKFSLLIRIYYFCGYEVN